MSYGSHSGSRAEESTNKDWKSSNIKVGNQPYWYPVPSCAHTVYLTNIQPFSMSNASINGSSCPCMSMRPTEHYISPVPTIQCMRGLGLPPSTHQMHKSVLVRGLLLAVLLQDPLHAIVMAPPTVFAPLLVGPATVRTPIAHSAGLLMSKPATSLS
jgi:hypothetical protein